MSMDRGERTEKPTAKRLRKAREEGQVPRSNELPQLLTLVGFLVFAELAGSAWLGKLRGILGTSLAQIRDPFLTADGTVQFLSTQLAAVGGLVAMPVLVMSAGGLLGNTVQGTATFTLKPLKIDPSRINPVKGLRKIFKVRSLMEAAKAVAKLIAYSAVAWIAVRSTLVGGLDGAPGVEGALAAIAQIAERMLLGVIALSAFIALIDVGFTRWNHARELRMTKKEVKDEHKEMEGDPKVRAKIRQKQAEFSRARMMADVPDATVVVVNPTHYAVALRYVPGEMEVPKVLAKGRNLIAQRIREIAEEHGIPIHRDPPLARALHKLVEIGQEVPPTLYRAVAEVLAAVLEPARRRRRPAPRPGGDL